MPSIVDIIADWYTQFAATILSIGITNCVLTNHNPTVSATKKNKSANPQCIIKAVEKVRLSVSSSCRPKAYVKNLLVAPFNAELSILTRTTIPPTKL